MQAVVFTEQARVALAERPEPVAGDGEVLIRVGAAGICGTDLHAPLKPAMFAPGVVLGHEFAVADRRSVHEIPENVPTPTAAWTEPLAVAVRAVSLGRVRPGGTAAVLGAGAIGQLILQLALNAGAAGTVVVEPSRLRREVAVSCGAGAAVAPGEVDRIDRRYDVVFDCTGAADAFATSLPWSPRAAGWSCSAPTRLRSVPARPRAGGQGLPRPGAHRFLKYRATGSSR